MTTAHSGSGDLSRSMELLWRGKEPSGRGPRPGLTLEAIVDAAITLADREGIPALSMRRVAAELGVGTMSLYRYIPGKGELLDLMLDRVLSPGPTGTGPPPPEATENWRTAMEFVAVSSWRLYLAHPWLLQVNQTRPVLGPNALEGLEFVLEALNGIGLLDAERMAVIMAVDHYVTGTARTYVLQAVSARETGVSDEEFWAAQGPILGEILESGRFPRLAELDPDSFSVGGVQALRFGLDPLLDGLERYIDARRRGERPAPDLVVPGAGNREADTDPNVDTDPADSPESGTGAASPDTPPGGSEDTPPANR
ncbi:TetR family transcriptional regulator [Streptomyces alkaliphilus]|uniref:TetR family transcriptional regulator n=1 Tax=Streptomyces alkaliphilus TaxID=1472722 RepID=A0A7W3Y1S5_9ACTN|nr:TetR/AcrR family transcriptional regulator [Streptomyces alkaliphilus]MBB0245004.1 TetR family transcriptional regulator [Streptomyces alkaliphilus]